MLPIVYEDSALTRLGPLAQTRPVFALRCGAHSLLDRILRAFDLPEPRAFVRPEMAALSRFLLPSLPVNETVAGSLLLVNGRYLAPGHAPAGWDAAGVGMIDDEIAYAHIPSGRLTAYDDVADLLDHATRTLPLRPAPGAMIRRPWDLVEHNAAALVEDGRFWMTHRDAPVRPGLSVLGPAERLMLDASVKVEPMTVIDTTKGPVMLDRGVVVQAFTRLEGPLYVGPDTQILTGRIKASSIGEQCRLGGEVESSIVHGHSNKAHEGFLGHSYVGEWVNFAAGTQTSDLRNDYGKVTVLMGAHKVPTGLLKVGAFVGDHTKTSINTQFNTGSVAGPFGMLVSNGSFMPRNIPAFATVQGGRMSERTDLGEMFTTARVMMARRDVVWTEAHEDFFLDLYERSAGERSALIATAEQRRMRRAV